jgi:hypothetical protein
MKKRFHSHYSSRDSAIIPPFSSNADEVHGDVSYETTSHWGLIFIIHPYPHEDHTWVQEFKDTEGNVLCTRS